MLIRHSRYAGSWYPSKKGDVEKYLVREAAVTEKKDVLACVCPHAGWVYSGKVAASVYSGLPPFPVYVLIGVNHTCVGEKVAIYPEGRWELPYGFMEVENEIAENIISEAEFIRPDPYAHEGEHSLEVQLPFIYHASPQARIVPIIMYDYSEEVCRDIGKTVAKALKKYGQPGLIVASSDFSHVGDSYGHLPGRGFNARQYAERQDKLAVEKILALDPEGMLDVVRKRGITMCGSGPVATALFAAKELGAKGAELLQYATSADVSGDYDTVVGYAGIIIHKSHKNQNDKSKNNKH